MNCNYLIVVLFCVTQITFTYSSFLRKLIFPFKTQYETDPDVYLSTPGIISRHGYPCESHTIVSDDGFILTLHRIPYNQNGSRHENHTRKQPVLLHHGLLADSSCFLMNRKQSLPFLLSDAGYDVWLANARGTQYSNGHIKYHPSDKQYWDWSWDEMAEYDLTKILEYIVNITNQTGNLLYIGHSMGTTIFFASMSHVPKNNQYVKAMFALAPVAYTSHLKGPLGMISIFSTDFLWIYRALGIGEFIPQDNIIRIFMKYGCNMQTKISAICQNFIFLLTGFDKQQFNMTELPLVLSHLPAPTSVRTVVHFGQECKPNKFQHYDFGKTENLRRYGTTIPPIYNISAITVPVAAYVGKNDWLAQAKDVDKLWLAIPNKIDKYIVPYDEFNHMDFLWAKDVRQLLFNKLFNDMKQYS